MRKSALILFTPLLIGLVLAAAAPLVPLSLPAGLTVGPLSRSSPLLKGYRPAENFEPLLAHSEQDQIVKSRLAALEKRTGRKPNILILLVDDLGYGDVGAYGGGEMLGAPTPNIDRLAQQGLKLTSAYSQPTCTPTRAALNTGRLPVRSGLIRPTILQDTANSSKELFAARLLSDSGYRTGISGKWHLGEKAGSQPQQVGFDEFLGFLGVVDAYQDFENPVTSPEAVNNPELLAAIRSLPSPRDVLRASKGGETVTVSPINYANSGELDQQFANFSEEFIRGAVRDKKSFYLIHSFSKVHFFNRPAKDYLGRSPAKDPYHDAVVEVDDIVGRLTKLLDTLHIADNTLVVFLSDNGPEEDSFPDSGHTPFRGAKGTTLEGGVRIPAIFRWPNMIAAGRVSDGLFDVTDMFNTSLRIAGIDAIQAVPKDRYIDGIDQSGFLLTDAGQTAREAVYMYNWDQFMAVRWGQYKMSISEVQIGNDNVRAIGGLDNGLIVTPNTATLYNLYIDPKERRNVLIQKAWVAAYAFNPLLTLHGATMAKYPTVTKVRYR